LPLVVAEAVRAIDGQQANLDNLRARVGTLLSAAAIGTSFLGGIALDDNRLEWPGYLAVMLFVAHVALALVILWPRAWTFQTRPSVMVKGWIDRDEMGIDRFQRALAGWLENHADANAAQLNRLWRFYAWAITALLVEIVLWLMELGGFTGWLCEVLCR
jgi:hypothetical protein